VREFLGKQVRQRSGGAHRVPGVATGLAVTGTGGDVLFSSRPRPTDSNGNGGGGLLLTGQLGDVMKESAQIALSYVRRTLTS